MIEKSSPHFPSAFYRVSIKGLIVQGGKLLLGYEEQYEYYSLPGDGLDWGENPQTALKREIEEELQCTVRWIAEKPTYVLPHIVHNRRDMDWFFNLMICYAVDVDTSTFTSTSDYKRLQWFSKEELQSIPIFEGEEPIRSAFNPAHVTT